MHDNVLPIITVPRPTAFTRPISRNDGLAEGQGSGDASADWIVFGARSVRTAELGHRLDAGLLTGEEDSRERGFMPLCETSLIPTSTSMDDVPITGSMTSIKSLSCIPIPANGTTSLVSGYDHPMLGLRHGFSDIEQQQFLGVITLRSFEGC